MHARLIHLLVLFAVWRPALLLGQVNLTPIVEIGELNGRPATTFGEIESVAVDSDGRIYVLDQMAREIRVFDAEGRHVQTVGRKGGGPGEYLEPRGLTLMRGQLLVLDARQMRVSSYGITDSLEYIDETRIDIVGMDMCALDGRLFILGFNPRYLPHERIDGVVHEYSLGADSAIHLAAFGSPFSDHILLSRTLANGLACLAPQDLVVVFSRELGATRWYSPDGDLVWDYVPDDWQQVGLTGNPDGSATWSCPETGKYEYLLGVATISTEDIALQTAPGDCATKISPTESSEIEWRVVNLRRGEIWRQLTRCRVMAARGNLVYCVASDPYPRLRVLRRDR